MFLFSVWLRSRSHLLSLYEISILTSNLQHQNRLHIRSFPFVTSGIDYIRKMTDWNDIFTLAGTEMLRLRIE